MPEVFEILKSSRDELCGMELEVSTAHCILNAFRSTFHCAFSPTALLISVASYWEGMCNERSDVI